MTETTRPLTLPELVTIVSVGADASVKDERVQQKAMMMFRQYVENSDVDSDYSPSLVTVLSDSARQMRQSVTDLLAGFEGDFGADRLTVKDAAMVASTLRSFAHMIERDAARAGGGR